MNLTSPLPAGMGADDALDFLAAPHALVFFTLCMPKLAELRAVFFRHPILPTSHSAHLRLGDAVPAAKETRMCKSSGYDPVEASFAESMFATTLFERAAAPILSARDRRG